jgi:hypothetical protein
MKRRTLLHVQTKAFTPKSDYCQELFQIYETLFEETIRFLDFESVTIDSGT